MSLMLTALCLTGCFSVFSSSKNSSSNSNNYYSSSDVDDGSTYEIVRKEHYGIVNYDYIFTNGGYKDFALKGTDKNGNPLDIDSYLVDWRVSDDKILGVDSFGDVTAKKNGTASLIAFYKGHRIEKEITVATIAKTFEKKDDSTEFRVGNHYSLPLNIDPANATLDIKTSNDVLSFSEGSSAFNVIKVGETDVTVTAFTDWMGNQTTLDFHINTTDPSAPIFKYKNKTVLSVEVTFAKNKYQTLKPSSLGITAESSSGLNLTNYITITGDYDLSKKGTYQVKLSVTDPYNESYKAYCDLTMVVTEYETIEYKTANYERFDLANIVYEYVEESPYSLAIAGITFNSKITLKSKYHHAVGTLSWRIYFKISNWGEYRTYDYSGDALTRTYTWREDGSLTLSLSYTFNPGVSLKKETFEFSGHAISFEGSVYEYKYY